MERNFRNINYVQFGNKLIPSLSRLSEPMGSHTFPRPLRLANPAPMKLTRRPSADHMHATAGSLRRRSTFGTRLRDDANGDAGRFIPAGEHSPIGIYNEWTIHSPAALTIKPVHDALSNVITL